MLGTTATRQRLLWAVLAFVQAVLLVFGSLGPAVVRAADPTPAPTVDPAPTTTPHPTPHPGPPPGPAARADRPRPLHRHLRPRSECHRAGGDPRLGGRRRDRF